MAEALSELEDAVIMKQKVAHRGPQIYPQSGGKLPLSEEAQLSLARGGKRFDIMSGIAMRRGNDNHDSGENNKG